MTVTPTEQPWTKPTEALWRAVKSHDLNGARKALFQGADPNAVQQTASSLLGVGEGPLISALFGDADLQRRQWMLDLPMLDLLFDHGASFHLPEGHHALSLVSGSRAFNADDGIHLLVQRGAQPTLEMILAVLLSLRSEEDTPHPGGIRMQADHLPVADALWNLASESTRQALRQKSAPMLTRLLAKPGMRDIHDRARAWFTEHGCDVEGVTRPVAAAPAPAEHGPNVVSFRRRLR